MQYCIFRHTFFLVAMLFWLNPNQALSDTNYHFDLQSFHGVSTSGGLFTLEGSEIGTHLRPRGGIQLKYAHDPLIYEGLDKSETSAIKNRLDAEINISMGLFNRVEIGAALPLVLYQGGDEGRFGSQPQQTGIGDLRIVPKVRIYGHWLSGLSISVLSAVRFPTASEEVVAGGGWAWEPQVSVNFRIKNLSLHSVLGYRMQQQRRLYSLDVDDQLSGGIGARYRFGVFSALAEITVATAAASPFSDTQRSPMLATLGATYSIAGFAIGVGGGPGLIPGYGAPAAHAMATVGYAPWGVDADGDRVPDSKDSCPHKPEDRDGFADNDGCPDLDNDGDRIPDGEDKCPDQAEDLDKFADNDGCPDLDNDKDRILDKDDSCPNEPEDRDGFADHDGCPDTDNDRDGILDKDDKCPNEPEVVNGVHDEDGCPEPDRDRDGILDKDDKCPDKPEDKNGIEDEDGCPDDPDGDKIPNSKDRCPEEPETINGYQDTDGCPDSRVAKVVIKRNVIWTSEAIYFPTDKWGIQPRFHRLLKMMAKMIRKNRKIRLVYVEGHADGRGDDKYNQWLSFYRARSVVRYLRKHGVERGRLRALGWGEQQPWDTNTTRNGMARNRRVLFHVVYRMPKVRFVPPKHRPKKRIRKRRKGGKR